MTIQFCSILLAAMPAFAQVEGKVLNALNGEPIPKARVVLRSSTANYTADSNSDGTFRIAGVAPGDYQSAALRARLDAAFPSDMPRVTVANGQAVSGLVLRLTPLGVISGHILDSDGDPVSSAAVEALQYAFVKGQKQLQSIRTASSNDRGEYRLFDLLPGQYYLRASKAPPPLPNSTMTPIQIYFGDVLYAARASALELAAGGEVGGADIRIPAQVGYSIRGRFPPGVSGPGQVMLQSRDTAGRPAFIATAPIRNDQYLLPGVTPGVWVVRAMLSGPTSPQAIRIVEIVDHDVDDADLTFFPPVEIPGIVKVAGSVPLAFANLGLRFQGTGNTTSPAIAADGTFVLHQVLPDLYAVSTGVNAYPVSMKLGEQSFPARQLDLRQGGSGTLTILVSAEFGQIDGTVVDTQGAPVVAATVMLIPEQDSPELYLTMLTDAKGRFSFTKVVPARYRAFAWRDPPKTAPADSLGVSIEIQPNSRQTLELKAISAR